MCAFRILPRRRAAGQQSAAAAQHLERFCPTIAAGEVDDHVHSPAFFAGEDAWATEQTAALGHPIGVGVVDADVGAERFQMLELLLARGASDDHCSGLLHNMNTARVDAAPA